MGEMGSVEGRSRLAGQGRPESRAQRAEHAVGQLNRRARGDRGGKRWMRVRRGSRAGFAIRYQKSVIDAKRHPTPVERSEVPSRSAPSTSFLLRQGFHLRSSSYGGQDGGQAGQAGETREAGRKLLTTESWLLTTALHCLLPHAFRLPPLPPFSILAFQLFSVLNDALQ